MCLYIFLYVYNVHGKRVQFVGGGYRIRLVILEDLYKNNPLIYPFSFFSISFFERSDSRFFFFFLIVVCFEVVIGGR